jgi:hypothetical protein
VTGVDQVNLGFRGLHLIVDATVIAGGETVTPKLQGFDSASGKYYDLLVGVAISATGTTVLKLYPSISAVANVAASDVLPAVWRVVLTHSASGSHTYTVGAVLVV